MEKEKWYFWPVMIILGIAGIIIGYIAFVTFPAMLLTVFTGNFGDGGKFSVEAIEKAQLIVIGIYIYIAPSIIAYNRKHHQNMAITALNILLGWSIIGWIVALIWSLSATVKDITNQSSQ